MNTNRFPTPPGRRAETDWQTLVYVVFDFCSDGD